MKVSRLTTAMAMAGSLAMTGCKIQESQPRFLNKALLSTVDSIQIASKKALQENPKLECYDSAYINVFKNGEAKEYLQKFQELKDGFLKKMPRESIGEGKTKNAVLPNDLTDIRLDKYRKSTVTPVVADIDTSTGRFMNNFGHLVEVPDYLSTKIKVCAESSPFL